MSSEFNPNPDELQFDFYELAGRAARRRRRAKRKARRRRIFKKIGKGVKKVGKGLGKVAKIAGPLLTVTGIGAPLGAALTAGTAAAGIAKRIKSGKAGNVAATAAKVAGELTLPKTAAGPLLGGVDRKLLQHPDFRRAVLSSLTKNAEQGNAAALQAVSQLQKRANQAKTPSPNTSPKLPAFFQRVGA